MAESLALRALAPAVHRWALYFAPAADSPWARAGARWLGRDADGAAVEPPRHFVGCSPEEWSRLTAAPRRCGWHATLRAPMRLSSSYAAAGLLEALRTLAAGFPAFELPALHAQWLDGFIALQPQHSCPPLQALERACVSALQPLAAPLLPAEPARYDSHGLSARQHAPLRAWGYPYVFEDFRFHMTLAGRIDTLSPLQPAAPLEHGAACFGGLPQPLRFDALSLFVEPAVGAPLRRVARVPLTGMGHCAR